MPTLPIIIDSVMAIKKGCTYREIKTYQHYCYIVSDDGPPNTFQIVDMQYLPDSVHLVHNDTTYFETCHTIFIDKDNMYCGYPKKHTGAAKSMQVYSLATPTAPVLQRTLNDDTPANMWLVHDMYVNNDTVFASCGGFGLNIYKFNGTNPFTNIANYANYPGAGYNHSSWLTANRKTLVFTDEVPAGLPLKTIDVQNLNNIVFLDTTFSHTNATAHNPYVVGNNWCWVSSYQDGIYLYDISNPAQITKHGFFDTHPQHGFNDNYSTDAYRGNWGAYPYLPSKIIIATDMQNGIFILDGDSYYKSTVSVNEIKNHNPYFSLFPNPASNKVNITISKLNNQLINYKITDILGNVIETNQFFIDSENYKLTINTAQLNNGFYFLTMVSQNNISTQQFIIQH